jgi:uncharacterized LabA/DUF88 family protein
MEKKLALFIDGTWLYKNIETFNKINGIKNYKINFYKVINLLIEHLNQKSDFYVSYSKGFYFGSIAVNKPGCNSKHQKSFHTHLTKAHDFETEIYEIDFKNSLEFKPKEKFVDVALASSMLYHAAIADSYDIAALLSGDGDFYPAIKFIKLLGKQSLLISIEKIGNISPTNAKLIGSDNPFDYPPLFLDYHFSKILRNMTTLKNDLGYALANTNINSKR